MEPEVHLIEKYFQEILHCFTMTNVRLKRGKEIDLLAINPMTGEKFHVEARVATSRGFALREKDTYTSQGRPHRRGLDYFAKEKFDHLTVVEKIRELFGSSDYRKVLIVWNTEDNFAHLPQLAKEKYNIEIWGIRHLLREFMKTRITTGSRDDILRTMELVSSILHEEKILKLDRL
ncbi:hypothetical protein KEJ47_08980 [Candidatus Bathyarchaeota archaeon]|nr:hypothetical protein [Candidatus Bathyarchaeota archaeon]